MNPRILNFGLILFALAFTGLGLLQIFNGEFLAGRPMAWPEGVPGKYPLAIITGLLLITAGIAAALRKLPVVCLIVGLWILLWAASRNLFFIISNLDYG